MTDITDEQMEEFKQITRDLNQRTGYTPVRDLDYAEQFQPEYIPDPIEPYEEF